MPEQDVKIEDSEINRRLYLHLPNRSENHQKLIDLITESLTTGKSIDYSGYFDLKMALVKEPYRYGICETCSPTDLNRIKWRPALTAYHWEGVGIDPNLPFLCCDECYQDYEEYWTEMWNEYYNSIRCL